MLIGLDLGTAGVKALLVDLEGRILARAAAPVKLHRGSAGAVEQDLKDIWSAACKALRGLRGAGDLSAVRAMGVSSQGGAIQVITAQGRPAGPVISWLDGRGKPYDQQITEDLGRAWFTEHTGHGGSAVAVGQILRLDREAPRLLQRPASIRFVGDCIVQRLCGQFAQDATSLSIAVMLNPRLRNVDPELLEVLKIDAEQLSPVLPVRQAAGALSAKVAADTGLPAGIPVSIAVHDQYAAALGTAAVHDGDVMFGAGTAWVLLAAAAKSAWPVIDSAFVCPHVVEGLYGQLLSLGNGGSSVSWALDFLGFDNAQRGDLDGILGGVPAGCDGLRAWPFLASGRAGGLATEISGRLAGLRLEHTRAHCLRAIVEGLACELARYLGFLEEAGLPIEHLRMCGGGARGSVTPQIIADVTGLPVAGMVESEMSALGAAVIARGLLEPAADLLALAEQMAPAARMFHPGTNARAYREILAEYLGSLPGGPFSVVQRTSARGPGGAGQVRLPSTTLSCKAAGDQPLHHVWTCDDVDRAFWADHLEDWVPRQITDAHIHLSDPRNRLYPMTEQRRRQYWVAEVSEPLEARDAQRCLSIVYPGRDVRCVAMGSPDLDFDLEAENTYNQVECAKRGWWSLALLRPQWSAERVAAELDRPGVIGVKPYYSLIGRSPDTRDEHLEAGIFDFLPHHALEVLNDRHVWVTLHVPKAARLGHPDNIRQITEIRRRYPNIVLVIAHLGRCYTEPHAQEALPRLADDPGIYFDNSAVLNPYVHRLALRVIGPDRILYGTDNPVFFMRGRRQWRGRTYINRTNHPFYFNKLREPPEVEAHYTLYMYEALRALKDACRQLGVQRSQIEAVFSGNARRLIHSVTGAG
jgi:sugar (pentulose or hexulose) kinase/predicted TIM-barrel fold metal-dependent hydrolase